MAVFPSVCREKLEASKRHIEGSVALGTLPYIHYSSTMQMGKPTVEDAHRAKHRLGQRMDGPEGIRATNYGAHLVSSAGHPPTQRVQWFPSLMLGNPDWSAIFAPGGAFLREGDVIKRTNYSRTLATIASEGPDAFYKVPFRIFSAVSLFSISLRAPSRIR